MTKVLIIKTSSMGDIIHSFPAITDLEQNFPQTEVHWLCEESFGDIPLWHPHVKKVHHCAIRRWRKKLLSKSTYAEIKQLKSALRDENYDLIIDLQGLIKSAFLSRKLGANIHGYDKGSIKEPLASYCYNYRYPIDRNNNAISRNRQLLAKVFAYSIKQKEPDFKLMAPRPKEIIKPTKPYIIFLHGTNWPSKQWPVPKWVQLANLLSAQNLNVYLPYSSVEEKKRAEKISEDSAAKLLPKMSLKQLAYALQQAAGVICVDTGLAHMSAALNVATVGLYGASNVELTALNGRYVTCFSAKRECSPCLKKQCAFQKEASGICYQTTEVEEVAKALSILQNKKIYNTKLTGQ